jgi:hypothetical protein
MQRLVPELAKGRGYSLIDGVLRIDQEVFGYQRVGSIDVLGEIGDETNSDDVCYL